jgi:carbon storage regulator
VIVIPRKRGESVILADDIILTVIEIRGDKVRLGVEVPKRVSIYTGEVFEATRSQQEHRQLN